MTALAVWSLVFWTTAFAWMLVGALLTYALLLVGVHYRRVHMWVTAPTFKRCVQLALVKLRVHYHRDFDPEVRGVFAQNHVNLLDGHAAAWAIPHAFSGLMNAWQFHIPIYGWLMRASKGIPVHRGRRDEVVRKLIEAAKSRHEMGMSILVFPEAHRSRDGRVQRFNRGVFLMAAGAGLPVVPVAVRGMFQVNRKGSNLFHPFQRVDIFVGPQFSTAGVTDRNVNDFAEQMRAYVDHCLEQGEFPERAVAARQAEPAA